MTERDLSQRLEELADRVAAIADPEEYYSPESILEIANAIRQLSKEKYTQGSVSWDDVKQAAKPTRNRFPF